MIGETEIQFPKISFPFASTVRVEDVVPSNKSIEKLATPVKAKSKHVFCPTQIFVFVELIATVGRALILILTSALSLGQVPLGSVTVYVYVPKGSTAGS